MKKIMCLFGTRPEAIKMAPLIKRLEKDFEVVICVTAQHREMLDQVLEIFEIVPDIDLDIMEPGQSLTLVSSNILLKLDEVFNEVKPDLVLVHGDTTTTMVGALSAFYHQIPIGHVEAGLRTHNRYFPFPEEMNRVLTSRLAVFHFAPTESNVKNLKDEGITQNVYKTGNTIVDALAYTVDSEYELKSVRLSPDYRLILVTAHRRENLGEPLKNICQAVLNVVNQNDDVEVVFPVHPNPQVKETVESILGNHPRIQLIEPLDVKEMHNVMAKSYLILTDSGGLQEEAPSLGVPVIVLRNETERQEAVDAGTVILAGTNQEDIERLTNNVLNDTITHAKMSKAENPYGDGLASERIARHLIHYFGDSS